MVEQSGAELCVTVTCSSSHGLFFHLNPYLPGSSLALYTLGPCLPYSSSFPQFDEKNASRHSKGCCHRCRTGWCRHRKVINHVVCHILPTVAERGSGNCLQRITSKPSMCLSSKLPPVASGTTTHMPRLKNSAFLRPILTNP